jgi:hypothetical protein
MAADAWIGLVLLLASGIFLADLLGEEASGAFVTTTTLPIALVILLAGLAVVLLVTAILRPRPAEAGEPARGQAKGLARVAAMVAWIALYITALPQLGYMAASIAFLIGAALLYGNRRWPVILIVAGLLPLALLLFFERFMIVLLPDGALWG